MSRDAALQRVARPAFKRDMSERAFARSCARHGSSHVPEKTPTRWCSRRWTARCACTG